MFWQIWECIVEKLKRRDKGQGSIEYVMVILGVVLFLIAAAFVLRGVLSGAVSAISIWISRAGSGVPPVP